MGYLYNYDIRCSVEPDDIMLISLQTFLKIKNSSSNVSTDKDFLQLVNDTTIVWSPTKKKLYNTKLVKEEYGIESKNFSYTEY